MQDLLFETIAFERIALFSKLVARANCTCDEKEVALIWLGELTGELSRRLEEYESKNPQEGGNLRSGCSFQ